ncbi:hypothetical protein [Deltalipothrixvirus pozzuoliense]|uniref:Putative transmembrane protein ORF289 n=1 Tax=Acidianus filamentous virus 2 (isolate Italy/Pozzuoli) TaxID=654910 RepID=Y289_AFV2P|nr:hypothetical protein AFV2_gp42 [Acidianus filamentous virus 2]Q573C7.1 RecName: Full=Putative transmembrane protein ORF289 [Acidianus filamentous virus 2 (isolate Pozzuoli)]CAH69429.1 hypothetical protein [Acidianus filamentous virus 2]
MAIAKEFLLTVLNYIANGVVNVQSSTTQAVTTLAPYQIIAIMKNNNVTVSRTTITSISVSDVVNASQEETLTIRYSGTDASPFTYTTDEIEIWASTQSALLYKIADIQLQTPLSKTEHDYLNIEYEIIITAGASYTTTSSMSQYTSVVTFRTLVAPILYFFALFLVPAWSTVLKQNPTFPQSQLSNYISPSSYQGINAMYVGSNQVTIVSKLVGFGTTTVSIVVNGEVTSTQVNAPIFIGVTTPSGVLVLAYNYYSGTISKYVSLTVTTTYGSATVINQFETKTTGGTT